MRPAFEDAKGCPNTVERWRRAVVRQDRRSKLAESQSVMSSSDAAYDGPADAPRVGADLRAARHRLGWELPEVAAGLRIRLPYLEALEDGRIADLPGNAYALGFLRTYATALGLDPYDLSRRFKAEAAAVNRKTELAFPVPVPERGVPAGAVVLLGAVLAVGAYVGWYRLSAGGAPAFAFHWRRSRIVHHAFQRAQFGSGFTADVAEFGSRRSAAAWHRA